ncbi:MAG: hypothetical protein ACSLFP_09210 [Acidimicrobiales bacterium]
MVPRSRVVMLSAVVLGVIALAAGCAERGVASAPEAPPSGPTWVAVWLAVLLAAAVWGHLLTRARRRPAAGAVARTVLALQAGSVVVGTAVLVGLAVRSGQLADQPPDAEVASSLVRVGQIDGDSSLFALVTLVVVAIGALVTLILVLAARFVHSPQRGERWSAVAVLVAVVATTGAGAVLVAGGSRWTPLVVLTLQLPLASAALMSAWPGSEPPAPAASG